MKSAFLEIDYLNLAADIVCFFLTSLIYSQMLLLMNTLVTEVYAQIGLSNPSKKYPLDHLSEAELQLDDQRFDPFLSLEDQRRATKIFYLLVLMFPLRVVHISHLCSAHYAPNSVTKY